MSLPNMTVVFMGSPEFAVPTLRALVDAPAIDVVRVVTQPDRPAGRGKRLMPTPVKRVAIERGIPVVEMSRANYGQVAQGLAELEPDFVVVVAFGIILRKDVLELPRYGCVNLHASLLPRHRGVSPIQAAIREGDARTGVTTMRIDEGVDTGDILLTEETPIEEDDTAGILEARLSTLGAPLVVRTLEGLVAGTVRPAKQDPNAATYAKKLRKSDGLIDWTRDAPSLARLVRAMNPWPSAFTFYAGKRLIVLEAVVGPAATAPPGTVQSTSPLVVAAGEGSLELVSVKVEGKKAMAAASFLTGHQVHAGDRLGD